LRPTRTGSSASLLVLGLGNPGAEFAHTRHNAGADTVALLADRAGSRLKSERGTHSLLASLRWPVGTVVVAFPQTYMNDSGLAAAALVRRYSITDLSRLVVVHDELDLPTGRVKLKVGGGTAGHNGLASIDGHLHDRGYVRVRIGIGKPPGSRSGVDHVLRKPARAERDLLDVAVQVAADAVEVVAADGIETAMNRFNADDAAAPR
jgi:peptidyl-tRNA hydrolase, PTH1 family